MPKLLSHHKKVLTRISFAGKTSMKSSAEEAIDRAMCTNAEAIPTKTVDAKSGYK